MRDVLSLVPQNQYRSECHKTAAWFKQAYKASVDNGELTQLESFRVQRTVHTAEGPISVMDPFPFWDKSACAVIQNSKGARDESAKKIIKAMFQDRVNQLPADYLALMKAGVTTSLGYNFFDLRPPAMFLFPVNTPFRNAIPRIGRVNPGVGVAAHWKATRDPGTNIYVGVSEGKRNATATPDENDYLALYKQIGVERAVTFEAQFASEGYSDQLGDEHLRGLYQVWLGEEGMDLLGNSGTTNGNGYQLARPAAPVVTNPSGTNTFSGTTNVSVFVIPMTGMGFPANTQYGYGLFPTVSAAGLTPSYQRNNADGSADTIFGGFGPLSPASNVQSVASGHVGLAVVTPVKGAFAYAWYVNVTDASAPATSNAFLYAITQFPTVTITGPPGSTQAANSTGLNLDNSAQPLDYDGLITYAVANGYYADLAGAHLTSENDGRVTDVETALEFFFQKYQAGVDEIWGDATAITALDKAVRAGTTTLAPMQIMLTRDQQNNLLGGFLVSAYQSRYAVANPTGANAIPIRIHPMIPPGTLFFHIKTNPYPHSRVPYLAGMLMQRDYYSVEWPVTTRTWTFGTYTHQTLAHTMPWLTGIITGIGG